MANSLVPLLDAAATRYGLPPNLLVAQAGVESSFRPGAVSPAGAQGVLQLMPATARALGVQDPMNPQQNIDGGARLMQQDLQASHGNVRQALRLYHGGTDPANWGPKTEAYVDKVTKTMNAGNAAVTVQDLDKLYGGSGAPSAPAASVGAQPPAAPSPTPAASVTVSDLDKLYGGAPTPAGAPQSAEQIDASPVDRFLVGVGRGMLDVGQTAKSAVLHGAADVHLVPSSVPKNYDAQVAQDKQLYQATKPTVGMDVGQVVGQTAATLPVMVATDGAIGAGAARGAAALGDTAAGNVVRGVGNLLTGTAGAGMEGAPGLLVRGGAAAAQGALYGAQANLLTGQPVRQGAEYGAVLGPAFRVLGAGAGAAKDFAGNLLAPMTTDVSPAATARAATNRLLQAAARDGVTPEQIVSKMRDMGPGATPVDAVSALTTKSGANVRQLAEEAAATPGPAQGRAAQVLEGRAEGAPARINAAVKEATGAGGSVHAEAADLMQRRAADAAPLYEKAFAGGSTAPLQTQFEQQFGEAVAQERAAQQALAEAEHNLTGAMGRTKLAGPRAYSVAPAVENQREAQAAVEKAQAAVQQAQAGKEAILARLRQAQADGSANAPGAVWSQRLQQFLDDPIAKVGLHQGLEVQRLESLAQGKPFNPTEYGIVGTDESGAPLVGAVPNMRTLDAVKRGLDNIVEQYRDPTTGRLVLDQRGRAVDSVRKAFVDHLDTLNPDYAAARAAWAGPSQSLDALSLGRRALSNDPEITASVVSRMSPSDRQFFLSGVTRALQDKIAGAQDGADVTRKIFGNSLIRSKIAAAFDDPQAFARFEQQMRNEAQFAATRNEVLKGSQTARRLLGAAGATDIATPINHLVRGDVGSAARTGANALTQWAMRPSEKQLAARGDLLFNQDPGAVERAFAKVKRGRFAVGLRNALTDAERAAAPGSLLGYEFNQSAR